MNLKKRIENLEKRNLLRNDEEFILHRIANILYQGLNRLSDEEQLEFFENVFDRGETNLEIVLDSLNDNERKEYERLSKKI